MYQPPQHLKHAEFFPLKVIMVSCISFIIFTFIYGFLTTLLLSKYVCGRQVCEWETSLATSPIARIVTRQKCF